MKLAFQILESWEFGEFEVVGLSNGRAFDSFDFTDEYRPEFPPEPENLSWNVSWKQIFISA